MKILITSGGTKIKIDQVRSISNMSKGTFGTKIANAYLERDDFVDKVTFLYAKDSMMPVQGDIYPEYEDRQYETFDDYAKELDLALSEQPDVVILAAAVSDYGVESFIDGKIRTKDELVIRLKPLPKLIATVREKAPNAIIVGFKLLVNSSYDELMEASDYSLINNKLDFVVANDLRDIRNGNHIIYIKSPDRIQRYSAADGDDLALAIVEKTMEIYDYKNGK